VILHRLSLRADGTARAFSMTELLIAVVILGIGLLITSSMFPIAWYKARDVAESAVIPSMANAGEVALELQCRPARPQFNPSSPVYTSSFFPGDWFPAIAGAPDLAAVYPDTHVHVLNAGNYLADTGEDFIDDSGTLVPVADDGWKLEDNLDYRMDNAPQAVWFRDHALYALGPQVRAHTRLALPLEARPLAVNNPEASVVNLWEEKFELRRHCWAVLYKFNELPGLSYSVFAQDLNGDGNPLDPQDLARKYQLAGQDLKQPRSVTAYIFTLKRPVGARYVRQLGYDPSSASSKPIDPAEPEAAPNTPSDPTDVRLPVPWRFEATLVALPSASVPGVPSEIFVPYEAPSGKRNIMADVLDVDFVLLDDRTGQIFRITNRRENAKPTGQTKVGVVFTLDHDYTVDETENVPNYEPDLENSSITAAVRARYNWASIGEWQRTGCADDSSLPACGALREDQPEQRRYWVFLPPADAVRGANDTPVFNGSQPVVGVEVRQVAL